MMAPDALPAIGVAAVPAWTHAAPLPPEDDEDDPPPGVDEELTPLEPAPTDDPAWPEDDDEDAPENEDAVEEDPLGVQAVVAADATIRMSRVRTWVSRGSGLLAECSQSDAVPACTHGWARTGLVPMLIIS
jgi:hypothetical protein